MIDKALGVMMERGRAAAASMIDPETGHHPLVFVWRTPPHGVRITTSGSQAFALALETRLDRDRQRQDGAPQDTAPLVYLAHASEDKPVARAIAEHLLANGIDVWFDAWEITGGDSLRRKMEEGLGACTHFVVLLSPLAIGKPWVNEEIDAGFVRRVEGSSKFIPLRLGLPLSDLSPFLKGILSPEISPDSPPAMAALVDQIHGVSAKPPLGPAPRYVQRVAGLEHYSAAAIAIGKHLALAGAQALDPQLNSRALMAATGLSADDVELGTLDLLEAGLVEQTDVIGDDTIWPLGPLYLTFDPHVHDWRPADDARALASTMINLGKDEYEPGELSDALGWSRRRMNAALHAVKAAGLADTEAYLDGGGWVVSVLEPTARTRRAARSS